MVFSAASHGAGIQRASLDAAAAGGGAPTDGTIVVSGVGSSSTTPSLTVANPISSGYLVVGYVLTGRSATLTSVSDTAGNTWTVGTSLDDGVTYRTAMFWGVLAHSISAGQTLTFTLSAASGPYVVAAGFNSSAVAGSEVSATNNTNSANSTAASYTAPALLVGGLMAEGEMNTSAATVSGSWTRVGFANSGASLDLALYYKREVSGSSDSLATTFVTGPRWHAHVRPAANS
jgi:hypothetical protein